MIGEEKGLTSTKKVEELKKLFSGLIQMAKDGIEIDIYPASGWDAKTAGIAETSRVEISEKGVFAGASKRGMSLVLGPEDFDNDKRLRQTLKTVVGPLLRGLATEKTKVQVLQIVR